MGEVIAVDFRSDTKRREDELVQLAKAVMGLCEIPWTVIYESSLGFLEPPKDAG